MESVRIKASLAKLQAREIIPAPENWCCHSSGCSLSFTVLLKLFFSSLFLKKSAVPLLSFFPSSYHCQISVSLERVVCFPK